MGGYGASGETPIGDALLTQRRAAFPRRGGVEGLDKAATLAHEGSALTNLRRDLT
jgi:hypothetical protein